MPNNNNSPVENSLNQIQIDQITLDNIQQIHQKIQRAVNLQTYEINDYVKTVKEILKYKSKDDLENIYNSFFNKQTRFLMNPANQNEANIKIGQVYFF